VLNPNVSYWLNLDTALDNGASVMAGDRHLISAAETQFLLTPINPVSWNDSASRHGDSGYILFADGHVSEIRATELPNTLKRLVPGTNRLAVP
jgi:prepilin-type processing-associated H-X9-DG protein